MNKIIIVRAADTAWQEQSAAADENRLQGTVPLPLTEAGKTALQTIAAEIGQETPDCLFSSGNESSGPTADYLAGLINLKPRSIPELHELDCGLWQGLRIAQIKQRYGRAYRQWRSDPASVRPPQGETLTEAASRVRGALQNLIRKNPGKTAVLIVAQMVAALAECLLTGRSLDEFWPVADDRKAMQILDLLPPDECPDGPSADSPVRAFVLRA
ncbi:MAG: histidine phosphatase family protein [Sedimentisphaerales bacterium]|nr:histidine phosphatase family protein [Sedimentisphaerales bacterium]